MPEQRQSCGTARTSSFSAIYVVCLVVFPNLKLLRFCDKSTPVMDVLHHMTLRTSAVLEQQREQLLEPGLFELGAEGDVRREGEEVFGPESEVPIVAPVGEAGADDDDSEAVNQEMDLHARFVWEWDKGKPKL